MRSFVLFLLILISANSAQIKDLASVIGVRENQLIGYGLVVGLNGTGDGSNSEFTIQSLSNMLKTVNVQINPEDIKSKNTAAVMVTARLPAFARQGDELDITISSIGDAKNLMGGTLLLTALKGVDGEIYALAQGNLTLGGSAKKGGNHPTVATILRGALVEREVAYDIASKTDASLSLKSSNFAVAKKLQDAINARFDNSAIAIDPRTLNIKKPDQLSMVEFLAMVLNLEIDHQADAKIIIDERTGTLVSGGQIRVDSAVISHKGITLKIEPNSYVPFDEKNPVPNTMDLGFGTSIDVTKNTLNVDNSYTTLANVTRALNKLGISPSDMIAIIENLRRAGAINAQIEVI